ncbi:type II secretion system protein M [Psychromonas marina]|uniref:Type II secretion system protein M n=1 Tax=Psychromonas marina TaxID=88364 RepID=A0ABQ6E0D6_9GAMM|nr:type II secretion system protein M [Psychromonas marina]GLS90630.1 type II secretion system protein M [Psychromonas marina]
MEQFKAWWESITSREQLLTMISAAVIAIAIIFWGIWTPLVDQVNDSKKQLTRAQATLSWTQEKADVVLQSGSAKPSSRGGNLTQIINSSARRDSITFSRVVNKNDNIEVWINEVPFDSFAKWIAKLSNQYGVSVLSADLARTDRDGYIKVNRLLLGM